MSQPRTIDIARSSRGASSSAKLRWLRIRTLYRVSAQAANATGWIVRTRDVVSFASSVLWRAKDVTRMPYFIVQVGKVRRGSSKDRKPLATSPTRAHIIVNPASGSVRGAFRIHELKELASWLSEHGMPTEIRLTKRPGHATELAREAVRAGVDMVVAAGGDGTVNDVIQALAGHSTALGVLPVGTVNVWAREMGIPLNLAQAGELLLHGVRRRVDLGRAGTRYFLMMAGVGFDAEVARRVEKSPLKRLGLKLLDYLATAGVMSVTEHAARVTIRVDDTRISTSALLVIIGNTRLYGGAFTFTHNALADDGKLDLVVVGGGGLMYRLGVLGRALLRRPSLGPRVRYHRFRTLRLESRRPLPVQVDGEVIGTLPMTFTAVPHALTVIVPESAPEQLFRSEPLPAWHPNR